MRRIHSNLLILGVALGMIAALVTVGAGRAVSRQASLIEELKRNALTQYKLCKPFMSDDSYGLYWFSLDEAEALKGLVQEIAQASILSPIEHGVIVRDGDEILSAIPTMTDEILPGLGTISIIEGRFISPEDFAQSRRVCVVSAHQKDYLGATTHHLTIADASYEIIGTFRTDLSQDDTDYMLDVDYDKAVFIPATTAYKEIFKTDPDSAMVKMLSVQLPNESAAHDVQDILDRTKGKPIDLSEVRIMSGFEFQESRFSEQLRIMWATFATSLLILAIAGMNIVQVATASVADRSQEIGLKLALGARPRDIMKEIAIEVAGCTAKGGYIGIALAGVLNTQLNYRLGRYFLSFDIPTVLTGLGLSFIAGLITALIPALGAARLDPVQALRQE